MPNPFYLKGARIDQSAGAAKYTDCISAKRQNSQNECLGYDTKQFDDETPVMLELWGMQSTSLLLLLPGPLRPGMVAPERVLSMGQIELFDISTECKQMTYTKLNCLK